MHLSRSVGLPFSVLLACTVLCWGADLASAKRAYELKNYDAALQQLQPLAKEGNADAQFLLGKMYWMGQGVLKDGDQALKYFKESGEQGNADAQFYVGSYYLLPRRDVFEGLKWLKLSAEQGNQDAQLLLGKAYMDGARNLARDPVQGEMWLWLAAKGNLPFYQAQLQDAERQMGPDQVAKGKALAAAWKPKTGLKPEPEPAADGKQGNPPHEQE